MVQKEQSFLQNDEQNNIFEEYLEKQLYDSYNRIFNPLSSSYKLVPNRYHENIRNSEFNFKLLNKILYDIKIRTKSKNYLDREFYIHDYGWFLPNRILIEQICKFIKNNSCLELFAGQGLLSMLLKCKGKKIIPIDNFLSNQSSEKRTFCKIHNLNAIDAVKNLQVDTIIMSWVPKSNDGFQVLENFSGNKIVLIGERNNTADTEFYDKLDKKWICVKKIKIPNWDNCKDDCRFYERK